MSKIGQSILRGAKETLRYSKGKKINVKIHKVNVPATVDVKSIRKGLAMTREEFASTFGFSQRTLEKWEQGKRIPEGPARSYLHVIHNNPTAVKKALSKLKY